MVYKSVLRNCLLSAIQQMDSIASGSTRRYSTRRFQRQTAIFPHPAHLCSYLGVGFPLKDKCTGIVYQWNDEGKKSLN